MNSNNFNNFLKNHNLRPMREPKLDNIFGKQEKNFQKSLRNKKNNKYGMRRRSYTPNNVLRPNFDMLKNQPSSHKKFDRKLFHKKKKIKNSKEKDAKLEEFIFLYNDMEEEKLLKHRKMEEEKVRGKSFSVSMNRRNSRMNKIDKKINLFEELSGFNPKRKKEQNVHDYKKEIEKRVDERRNENFSYLVPPPISKKKKKKKPKKKNDLLFIQTEEREEKDFKVNFIEKDNSMFKTDKAKLDSENSILREKKKKNDLMFMKEVVNTPKNNKKLSNVIFTSSEITTVKKTKLEKANMMGAEVERGYSEEVLNKLEKGNRDFRANITNTKNYLLELFKRAKKAEKREGKLVVYVSHAKGLICRNSRNRINKLHNPFISIDIDDRPQATTKIIKKTSCPIYKELFKFKLNFEKGREPNFINFKIFDNKNLESVNSNSIGMVRIPLKQMIDSPQKWVVDGSFEIRKGPNMDRMNLETYFGELYLQAAWVKKRNKPLKLGKAEKDSTNLQSFNSTQENFEIKEKVKTPIDEEIEAEYEKNVQKVEDSRPNPKEDLEKIFGGNDFVKGTISTKVVFATDLKPPLDDIDDKINFSLDTFVEITFPGGKTKKTKSIKNTPYPIWNQFISNECKIKKDELQPLNFKIKTTKGNLIGLCNIKFEDLIENENDYYINGIYELENLKGDQIGSKIYLQSTYNTYGSKIDLKEVEFKAPKPNFDIDQFLAENKDMGIVVVKLLSFSIPKSLTEGKLDPYLKVHLPGGGIYQSKVEKDARFGYFGNLVLDRLIYEKHKNDKFIIKVFDYEIGTEEDDLIAEDSLEIRKVFRLANRWGYNCIHRAKLTPKYEKMMRENIQIFKEKNVDQKDKKSPVYEPYVEIALVMKFVPDKEFTYNSDDEDASSDDSSLFDDDVDYCVGEEIMHHIRKKYKEKKICGNLYWHVHKLIEVKEKTGEVLKKKKVEIRLKFPDEKKFQFITKRKKGKKIFFNERDSKKLTFSREIDHLEIIVELWVEEKNKKMSLLGVCNLSMSPLFKKPGMYIVNNYINLKEKNGFQEVGRMYLQLKWVNEGGRDKEFYPTLNA